MNFKWLILVQIEFNHIERMATSNRVLNEQIQPNVLDNLICYEVL